MNKKTISNGTIDIEYNTDLLPLVREAFNKKEGEELTDEDIFSYFQAAMQGAVNKGYVEVE